MVDDPHDPHDHHTARAAPLLTEDRVRTAQRYWWVLFAVGSVAAAIASGATQLATYANRSEQTAAELAASRDTALKLSSRVDVLAQAVRDITGAQGAAAEHFARVEAVLGDMTAVNNRQRDDIAHVRELAAAERERLGFIFDRLAPASSPAPAARKW